MKRYCGNCGNLLYDGAKFCVKCGHPVNARIENHNTAADIKKEPVNAKIERQNTAADIYKEPAKENVNGISQKDDEKSKDSGIFSMFLNEIKDLLRHPLKLLPTIILSVIWMLFSMLSTFGVNIPILRFLYTLTYSNGGMFGGFFGAVGGIFGKAVFATVVNTIVLSLFAKKNPFANAMKSLKGIFGKAAFSGLSAISPFLIGVGSGLLLYWLFNITSSPVNCAVAVVGTVGAFSAIGKKNGIITSLVFTVTGKLTKGRFPSQVTVNRLITGFSAGFALGLPLTFVRFGWLLFLIGAVILAAGIVFATVGKKGMKKMAATAALFVMIGAMIPSVFCANVFAVETLTDGSFTMQAVNVIEDDEILGLCDYIEQAFYAAGAMSLTPDGNGYTFTLSSYTDGFTSHLFGVESYPTYRITYTVPSLTFYVSAFETNDKGGYTAHVSTDSGMGIAINEVFTQLDGNWENWEGWDPGANYTLNQISFDLYSTEATLSSTPITFSTDNMVVDATGISRLEQTEGYAIIGSLHLRFNMDGITFVNAPVTGAEETEDTEPEETEEEEVKPYRGRLTYTNGEVNKQGQPFPDIMDFDGDGEISWGDYYIRKQLSRDPDWLDRPESKAVGAAIAVLTALLGAAGGVLGGPLGSLLGSTAQAAASAAQGALGGIADGMNVPEQQEEPSQKEDLGRYIRRDPDGDLMVRDPATGKETLYIKQEDGSYRNTVSDQNYTVGEIKNMVSHVEENKGYYSDISKKQQKAVNYQHEHASDFSETSVKLAEQIRQQNEQDAKEDAVYKIGYKHGVYNGDEDAIRERLAHKQAVEVSINDDYHRVAANIDTAVKVAEGAKKVADVAADVVGTVDKTGIFKDVYSATTAAAGNAGEVMAGNMTAAEAVAKTAVDASTEIIKNRAQSTGAKFAANILGDSAQDATSAMLEGKDLGEVTDAAIAGAGRGLLDSTVDYAISTGNKFVASAGKTSLTDAGETLASDLAKSALPKVEVPKKKEE